MEICLAAMISNLPACPRQTIRPDGTGRPSTFGRSLEDSSIRSICNSYRLFCSSRRRDGEIGSALRAMEVGNRPAGEIAACDFQGAALA